MQGTSMALPFVSGAAALVLFLHPELATQDLIARILQGTDKIDSLKNRSVSGGRLNLKNALEGVPGSSGP